MVYEERRYRQAMEGEGLVAFQVMVKETDLWICAEQDLRAEATTAVRDVRRTLERYIRGHAEFLSAMEPLPVHRSAPPLIQSMAEAGRITKVGPMAAVAGAVAEYVGRTLLNWSRDIIVENGGDLFLASEHDRTVSVYAGDSPFSNRLGLRIPGAETPLGICTSSGTVGHSISLGKSDAVCVLARDTALADAAATAAANRVQGSEDIQKGLDFLASLSGVTGGLIIVKEKMGAWGAVELVEIEKS